MQKHPETYTLNREQWLEINRALAGAALAMTFNRPRSSGPLKLHQQADNAVDQHTQRINRVREAQDILQDSYLKATWMRSE